MLLIKLKLDQKILRHSFKLTKAESELPQLLNATRDGLKFVLVDFLSSNDAWSVAGGFEVEHLVEGHRGRVQQRLSLFDECLKRKKENSNNNQSIGGR